MSRSISRASPLLPTQRQQRDASMIFGSEASLVLQSSGPSSTLDPTQQQQQQQPQPTLGNTTSLPPPSTVGGLPIGYDGQPMLPFMPKDPPLPHHREQDAIHSYLRITGRNGVATKADLPELLAAIHLSIPMSYASSGVDPWLYVEQYEAKWSDEQVRRWVEERNERLPSLTNARTAPGTRAKQQQTQTVSILQPQQSLLGFEPANTNSAPGVAVDGLQSVLRLPEKGPHEPFSLRGFLLFVRHLDAKARLDARRGSMEDGHGLDDWLPKAKWADQQTINEALDQLKGIFPAAPPIVSPKHNTSAGAYTSPPLSPTAASRKLFGAALEKRRVSASQSGIGPELSPEEALAQRNALAFERATREAMREITRPEAHLNTNSSKTQRSNRLRLAAHSVSGLGGASDQGFRRNAGSSSVSVLRASAFMISTRSTQEDDTTAGSPTASDVGMSGEGSGAGGHDVLETQEPTFEEEATHDEKCLQQIENHEPPAVLRDACRRRRRKDGKWVDEEDDDMTPMESFALSLRLSKAGYVDRDPNGVHAPRCAAIVPDRYRHIPLHKRVKQRPPATAFARLATASEAPRLFFHAESFFEVVSSSAVECQRTARHATTAPTATPRVRADGEESSTTAAVAKAEDEEDEEEHTRPAEQRPNIAQLCIASLGDGKSKIRYEEEHEVSHGAQKALAEDPTKPVLLQNPPALPSVRRLLETSPYHLDAVRTCRPPKLAVPCAWLLEEELARGGRTERRTYEESLSDLVRNFARPRLLPDLIVAPPKTARPSNTQQHHQQRRHRHASPR